MSCVYHSLSSVCSHEPAVSTVGLGSESSAGSAVSEEVYRPQFTMDQHLGACVRACVCVYVCFPSCIM